MENEKSNIEQVIHHLEEYIKTRSRLEKLKAAEKSSVSASFFFSSIILLLVGFFILAFGGISLAFFISAYAGSMLYGFLCVTGLFLMAGVMLYSRRRAWLETPMMNSIIKKIFQQPNE